jgi:hypothetical protein
MLFLVKVRVNPQTLAEFGQALQERRLDNSSIRATYCLRDDPAVGLGIWEVADEQELLRKLDPWRAFYSDVEVAGLVTPAEAQQLLLEQLRG